MVDKELVDTYYSEMFNDLLNLARDEIKHKKVKPKSYESQLYDLFEKRDKIKKIFADASEYERELLYDSALEDINYEIKRIRYRISGLEEKNQDINVIKSVPIETILKIYNIKHTNQYGDRIRFSIRDETIPSCMGYVRSNSWYDFGTGTGGSVIDLVMVIEQCSVSDAINKIKKLL